MPSPTILLADDEAHITCVVAMKLRSAGFNVVTARDGQEAFEVACKIRPNLVVTDLQMPRMSGLELAAKLSKAPQTSSTPIVMLTARGYILSKEQLAETNIRRLLPKPFSAKDILNLAVEFAGQPRTEAA
jgi:CheY-like chemotaxis protein